MNDPVGIFENMAIKTFCEIKPQLFCGLLIKSLIYQFYGGKYKTYEEVNGRGYDYVKFDKWFLTEDEIPALVANIL